MTNQKEQKNLREEEQNSGVETTEFLGEARELDNEEQGEVAELKEALAAEVFVDEAAVERTSRQINDAELINRLETDMESLSVGEREKMAKKIEEKGWFGIVNSLSAGDRVVYFNAPSGELAIKRLNDVHFGPQITDNILEKRNSLLNEKMSRAGAQMLKADYKSGIFKLDGLEEADLNIIAGEVDKEMTEFILEKIAQKISEIESQGLPTEELSVAQEHLSELKRKLTEFGFVMNYGVSAVEESDDENDKSSSALAVARAAEESQTVSRPRIVGEYGSEFREDSLNKAAEEVYGENGLAKKIDEEFGVLNTWSGESYKIFERDDRNFYILNKDLARAVRKNKIVPAEKNDSFALAKVGEYMRRVNLIDLVRPNTFEELKGQEKLPSGRSLAEEATLAERISAKLRVNDLNEQERKDAVELLRADNKDARFNSPEVFHGEAIKIKDCVYVSLDVLDLGVDLILSYEQSMQEIYRETDTEKQKEIVLRAGDEITKRMRDIRGLALELYKKHFGNEQATALVGGDEVTLALPEREGIDEFMLELQKMTGSRVIKTAVASAERHNGDEPKEKVIAEHLAALKRVEDGVDYAKKIEEKRRALERKFTGQGVDLTQIGKFLAKRGLTNVVIKETATGGFEAISRVDSEKKKAVPAKEAVRVLDGLLKDLTAQDFD